jgi:mono/diheme cytochrome c family protein
MRSRARIVLRVLAALQGVSLACGGREPESLTARGQRVYVANCIACHHLNPAIEGPLGPPIAGSPRGLIEARVLRAEYPPGYRPKRDTTLMQPLPYLSGEIDALAAYLDSEQPGGE